MKRYLVKETVTARESHPFLSGHVTVNYFGPGEELGGVPVGPVSNSAWFRWIVKEHGYKSRQAAGKNPRKSETSDVWDVKVEIVAFDV